MEIRSEPTDIWTTEPLADTQGQALLPSRVARLEERKRAKPWYATAFVLIAAVTALGGGLRFWHLSFPHSYVFDEVYYAKDGCYDAGYDWRTCHLDNPGEQTVTVHPPLGREIIAVSERLFGDDPFGWRFASAVFGTISVLLIAVLALKMFESAVWAAVAGLLLATENLNLVQSRISMLDIFLVAFVLAGFTFLVLDRRWIDRRTPPARTPTDEEAFLVGMPSDRPPSPVLRPWRLAAGLMFGAAAATKWSGFAALICGIGLAIGWEVTRRRRAGVPRPIWETLRDEAFGVFVFLVLLPLAVYVASYARWFADNGFDVAAWLHLQKGMATYSLDLRAGHPYASRAWTWIFMLRPVAYFYQCPTKIGATCLKTQEILGMGSPLIFWGSVITIPYASYAWVRRRDWRGGLIVLGLAVQWIPWFFAKRTSFLFYFAPMTPFLVLALVYSLRDLARTRVGFRDRSLAPVAAAVVVVVIAFFVFWWPILVGRTISFSAWQQRVWVWTIHGHHLLNWV